MPGLQAGSAPTFGTGDTALKIDRSPRPRSLARRRSGGAGPDGRQRDRYDGCCPSRGQHPGTPSSPSSASRSLASPSSSRLSSSSLSPSFALPSEKPRPTRFSCTLSSSLSSAGPGSRPVKSSTGLSATDDPFRAGPAGFRPVPETANGRPGARQGSRWHGREGWR